MSEQRIALRKLVALWDNAVGVFEQMGGEVRPKNGDQVFQSAAVPATQVSFDFDVRPVTFYVTERASASSGYLYIVLKGRISLSAQDVRNQLQTTDFSTEVAYFRDRLPKVEHVYGAHYDYAPGHRAHPLFHAQMKGYGERAELASKHFNFTFDELQTDPMDRILRSARLPCAQLDVFSTVLQIAADHLIDKNSSAEQLILLETLTNEVREIRGMGDILNTVHQAQCMRGVHWYPQNAA